MNVTNWAIPLIALAAMTSVAAGQAAPPPSRVMTLSAYGGYQFSASYDHADLAITRSGVNFDDQRIFNPHWIFDGSALFEDSVYDFNNFKHEVPGNKSPIDNAMMLNVLPTLTYVTDQHWSFTGGVIGQLAGQNSAMFDQGFTYGATGIVRYRVSPTLSLGGGLAWYTRLEQNSTMSPVLAIDWTLNDRWSVTVHGWTGKLNYKIDENLTAYFGAAYEWRQFRLEDSEPGAFSSGVLTDSDYPLKVGLQWLAFDQLTISGEVGVITGEELTFDDENGNRLVKHDLNITPYMGVHVDYKF